MSAAKFYTMRSCNDDYVPLFNVTRSTCEPNELEKKKIENEEIPNISLYPDANIQFRETKYVFPWIGSDVSYEPDSRLEALDAKLEAICADYEKKLNGSEYDIIRPDFDDETQMILEYVEKNKLSEMTIAEATEYLKSCHHCGNTDIPFGDEYCNERCQEYSIVYNYPCFRGDDCKACDNYWYHNSSKYVLDDYEYEVQREKEEDLVYDDSGEMTPRGRIITNNNKINIEDDDQYEEYSLSDRFDTDDIVDDLLDDDYDYCMECHEKKRIVSDLRSTNLTLCNDCLYLVSSDV